MEETYKKEAIRIYQKYGNDPKELRSRIIVFLNSATMSLGYEKAMNIMYSVRSVTL